MVRWLVADVVVDDRVRAKSLQPYLSALNRVHRDLEMVMLLLDAGADIDAQASAVGN